MKKTKKDESCVSSPCRKLSALITSESSQQQHDQTESRTHQPKILRSLDVGKNMILYSMEREKQNKNCNFVESFQGDCKSGLVDDDNLSLPPAADFKCTDQTFNSHEMELTLMADKTQKLQVSPFFHLSSHSSRVSEDKYAFNFKNGGVNFNKKFQITQPYLSSLSKNIGKENNPHESIPSNSADYKIFQTKQPSVETDSVSSEDNGDVWNVVLKPLNENDAALNMPPGLKNFLSQTPGAVYTLRKKRQRIAKDFLKECILSPEVKNILKRSERFHLKRPFSEMKACNPVSYDHKKSISFHSFGMDGSFTVGSKENVQLPTVQNSSLKATNEKFGMASISSLTSAPTSALMEGNSKVGPKENILIPPVQAFNSSLKSINENSGMTSIISLTPAPTSAFTSFVRPEANLSCQSNKVTLLEEKSNQNFSQIEDKQKSKNFSFSENDSLQLLSNSLLDTAKTMSEMFSSKILSEMSSLKNESSLFQSPQQDLHLLSKTSGIGLEENKSYIKNSDGNLSLSINQNEIVLKDPLLRCEFEGFNLEARGNEQNAIKNQNISKDFTKTETDLKCNEVKNSLISEEINLQNVSLDSKSLESQIVVDFNISEGSALKTTKNINLSNIKVHDLQKTNDPVVLEKSTIKDKIPELSGCVSKFEVAGLQETKQVFVSKTAVDKNEVSEQSNNKTILNTTITNLRNLSVLKTPNSEKSFPEKTTLKTDCPKQSKDQDIQNISDLVENNQELNYDDNEMKSSFNEIPNLRNNFFNQSVSLSGNSLCETNQKNSDAKFSLSGLERNVIWRTPNANESVENLTVQANESESLKEDNDAPTSGHCDSDPLQDVDSLRNKFEEASKGTHWKLKSLNKEEAVFELEWKVWFYRCLVIIHVKSTNVGESSITLTPCFDDPDDEYETLGYKFFQFLAKDEIVSFSLFSDDMIPKLAEYSNIAKRGEALMRDIMHVSVDEIYFLSDGVDPLELCVEVLNDNHMSKLLIIFQVNLRTYPYEKIIPEVKHMKHKDITKEIKEAIQNIEPGEDYLWNMVKLASKL